jgi:tyrosyl-tRNA synthetase
MESGSGISYTEFSYMLLQANDFRHLCEHHGVEMQMGGSDQWGNIVAGIDLIRRRLDRTAHGLTWPLLLKSDGTKFGKTASGAVWLDPERTSPYQFRQFWVQRDDAQVGDHLRRFSMRSLAEIDELLATHQEAPERRLAQRAFPDELIEFVALPTVAAAAEDAAGVLFGGDPTAATPAALAVVGREVPTSTVAAAALDDPVALVHEAGLASSRGEARRLLGQNGVRANGRPLTAGARLEPADLLHGRYLLLRKGKSTYHLAEVVQSEVGLPAT